MQPGRATARGSPRYATASRRSTPDRRVVALRNADGMTHAASPEARLPGEGTSLLVRCNTLAVVNERSTTPLGKYSTKGTALNLEQLALSLTMASTRVRVADPSVRALEIVDEIPPGYVWPNLREIDNPHVANVVLIVAAGAVGKSAAARALAARLRWPLVDAAKAQVGSYSLSGLLHDSLGFESGYMSEIVTGKAGVIVDALDEGHLRAGTSNFEEFMDNIRKLAGSDHGKSTVVVFSRPDTAEIVKLFMEEKQTRYAVLQLDFFSYEQACAFLDSHLDELHHRSPGKNYQIARQHPKAYADLRDLRLREIAQALLSIPVSDIKSEWKSVAEFLGYAPVLSVLAEYLAVPNPHAEVSRRLDTSANPSDILLQIVDTILQREQMKFQQQVCARLISHLPATEEWQNSEQSYSPTEQSMRLVAKRMGLDLAVDMPAMLPGSLRQQYETDAGQFTADHPFLAGSNAVNVVFEDFLLAKASADENVRVALKPSAAVPLEGVGPFFHRFVASFAPKDEDGAGKQVAVIPERLIGALLESHHKSQVDPAKALFVYVQAGEYAFLVFARTSESTNQPAPEVEYRVSDVSGVIVLPTRLARGVVLTDAGVAIGERSKRFLLGPAVTMKCIDLEIEASSISVDGTGKSVSQASLFTAQNIYVTSDLTIECHAPNSFAILGETEWPALRPFTRVNPQPHDVVSSASYVDLRAILKSFRQQAGSRPSVFKELLNQRVVKNSEGRNRFLRKLLAMGIVYETSEHYYLQTEELARLGISWHAIIDGVPTDSVLDFLVQLGSSE